MQVYHGIFTVFFVLLGNFPKKTQNFTKNMWRQIYELLNAKFAKLAHPTECYNGEVLNEFKLENPIPLVIHPY